MIYLIIAIFITPILLKTLQFKELNVKIILPTLITYSIWFLLSYLLIISKINIDYYLFFFYPFPFCLLIYEIVITIRKRNNLKINKFFYFLIAFIISNFIINSFTSIYLPSDSASYMKWIVEAYKKSLIYKIGYLYI